MIQFFNVNLHYGDNEILKHITFKIDKGEFVYLIGPSGAGKSSIINLINFAQFPDSGTVIVNQYSSAKIKYKQIPHVRRSLGVIFQDFKLLGDRNVYENIALTLRVTGSRSSEISKRVLRILAEVGLGHKRNNYPRNLSGGELQRVAIARALINNPFILLADEPTGNLDKNNSESLYRLILNFNKKFNQTFIIVTHNEVMAVQASRMIELEDGMVKKIHKNQ